MWLPCANSLKSVLVSSKLKYGFMICSETLKGDDVKSVECRRRILNIPATIMLCLEYCVLLCLISRRARRKAFRNEIRRTIQFAVFIEKENNIHIPNSYSESIKEVSHRGRWWCEGMFQTSQFNSNVDCEAKREPEIDTVAENYAHKINAGENVDVNR